MDGLETLEYIQQGLKRSTSEEVEEVAIGKQLDLAISAVVVFLSFLATLAIVLFILVIIPMYLILLPFAPMVILCGIMGANFPSFLGGTECTYNPLILLGRTLLVLAIPLLNVLEIGSPFPKSY